MNFHRNRTSWLVSHPLTQLLLLRDSVILLTEYNSCYI